MPVLPGGVTKNHSHDPEPGFRGLTGDWNHTMSSQMCICWSAEDAQTILQLYVTENSHSTVKLENFPHFCLMTFPGVSEMCGGWY